jgi:cell division septation protein DedD
VEEEKNIPAEESGKLEPNNQQNAAEKPEPQEEVPKFKNLAEKKKYIQDLKRKKELERKDQLKKEREEQKRQKRADSRNGKGSKNKLVIGIAFLLIAALGAGIYILMNKTEEKAQPEQAKALHLPAIDTVQISISEEPLPEPIPATVATKQSKWGLNAPCFIISHSSLKNEAAAKRNTDRLAKNGFNSGYYWIPDLGPGNNEYYKVYVGPFATEQAAIDKLADVRRYSKLAYIVELK